MVDAVGGTKVSVAVSGDDFDGVQIEHLRPELAVGGRAFERIGWTITLTPDQARQLARDIAKAESISEAAKPKQRWLR